MSDERQWCIEIWADPSMSQEDFDAFAEKVADVVVDGEWPAVMLATLRDAETGSAVSP